MHIFTCRFSLIFVFMLCFEFGALKSIANIPNSDVSDNSLGNIENVSAPRYSYLIFSDFNEKICNFLFYCSLWSSPASTQQIFRLTTLTIMLVFKYIISVLILNYNQDSWNDKIRWSCKHEYINWYLLYIL